MYFVPIARPEIVRLNDSPPTEISLAPTKLPLLGELGIPSAYPFVAAVVPVPVLGTGDVHKSGVPVTLIHPGPATPFNKLSDPVCPSKSLLDTKLGSGHSLSSVIPSLSSSISK